MSEKKLEPCPFCGSAAHVRTAYATGAGHFPEVMCGNPECEATNPNCDDTEESAIAAWNRRADCPTGWREGIEAAAKVCDEEALESYENSGFNAFNRAAKRILALVPPGDKEKESQDD